MSDSIENKLRNLSKAVKPEPTPFQDGPVFRGPGGPNPNTGSDCSFTPDGGSDHSTMFAYTMLHCYEWIITDMYCRRSPLSDDLRFCTPLYPGLPLYGDATVDCENATPAMFCQVTTRDRPLLWQRQHPDFDPANPSTWGSMFGPGGRAEYYVRYLNCPAGGSTCPDVDINGMVEHLRQLYIRKCGFAVVEDGACCFQQETLKGSLVLNLIQQLNAQQEKAYSIVAKIVNR